MLALVSEDAAIDDALYALDRAVEERAIEVSSFVKVQCLTCLNAPSCMP
jgi:hypothetical protein